MTSSDIKRDSKQVWPCRIVYKGHIYVLFLTVSILAIAGQAQTYGPGEIWYGNIRLQFSGRLLKAGTCSAPTLVQPGVTQMQCQVQATMAQTLELTATRTPVGPVSIRLESAPSGWPGFQAASGWGTVTAQYPFTPPEGSIGRLIELRFKAWTVGVIAENELRVILMVVQVLKEVSPPSTEPPVYGPFVGTTDSGGRFEVPIPMLTNTSVTGKLTECTVRTLYKTQAWVTLVPKQGLFIRTVGDIGAVRVWSPGYREVVLTSFGLSSSMDIWGQVHTTVDLGTVCLPPPSEPPAYGPFVGTTDSGGRFEVPIPMLTNTFVTGKLTECTVRTLYKTQVLVTLVPKQDLVIRTVSDIGAVRVCSPGYTEVVLTSFGLSSSMDIWGQVYTTVDLGTVCLPPLSEPPAYGPFVGTTDSGGRFEVPIPMLTNTSVTGKLTECTVRTLYKTQAWVTLVPKQGLFIRTVGDIGAVRVWSPGYREVVLTSFGLSSSMDIWGQVHTTVDLGTVCLPPACTLVIKGMVDDGAPHGGPAYPISKGKVWLFVLEEADKLPLDLLSLIARTPTLVTSTNHTEERSFDGTEFMRVEEARYEFRLQWTKSCPPRVVVVSLLWYDEADLMAVSSENQIGPRFVPVYLAKVITVATDPNLSTYGTAAGMWQKTGPNAYEAAADFSYGRDPLARHSATVIGVAGRNTSEQWERKGVEPDVFMRNCAHFYFYSYKAMRYFEHLAGQLGVGLKPVAVSMFTQGGTRCSSADVPFGGMAGTPPVTSDARVFIETGDSSPPWGGEKPDNSIWHEMGHYWWLQIYGSFVPGSPPPDDNHGGYANGSTADSMQEGFAEFTSMVIAEHYGDLQSHQYKVQGHPHNLEVDIQLWGPPEDREEFAIAGLLWDLHDGGGLETKPLGTISTRIATRDHVSLSDVEIFGIFVDGGPTTLKALHDALMAIPPYRITDTDMDGVPDVRELFVAHGGFEDTAPTNKKWDGVNEIIGFGGRAGRTSSPPLPQAYLRIRLVDTAGRAVPTSQATMRVDMRFTDPFTYYDYTDVRPLWADRVYFVMPPTFYQVTAFITVEVPGVGRSDRLEITAQQYWNLFQRAGARGLDHLLEYTFTVRSY